MLTINDVTSLSSRLACVLGLLVFPIVGCSDLGSDGSGGTGGGAGGTGATGGTGTTGGTPGLDFVQMLVTSLESPSFEELYPGPPLEGVGITAFVFALEPLPFFIKSRNDCLRITHAFGRFIAATASVYQLTLVTADERLLRGQGYETIRA